MNTWANELLMSSRRLNPSVLPLKEADRQRPLLVMYGGGGHLRDIAVNSFFHCQHTHTDVFDGKHYQSALK